MTIEQELLDNTPLPLDIIRYCIEAFLIPDQAHWRRKFDLVMKSLITKYAIVISIVATSYTYPRRPTGAKPRMRFRVFDIRDNCYKYDVVYYVSGSQRSKDIFQNNRYQSFEVTSPSIYGPWPWDLATCACTWINQKPVASRLWSWIKGSRSL